MKIDVPAFAQQLFARLCRGNNLILSQNGPTEDAELFTQVEAEENIYRDYFATLGFHLKSGDNCYYFTAEDDPQVNLEAKLEKMIRLVRLLNFLSTNVESFGEGQIFSSSVVAARCNSDPQAERFLQQNGKGSTNADRLENLLQSLVQQGYLSEYDTSRQEYRVLSAINYIFEIADRINIYESTMERDKADAEA